MRWTRTLRLRLRSLVHSSHVEQELDEELQYHLDRLVDGHVAAGMSVEDARYAARREMGAIEQRKEDCRDARGVSAIDHLHRDVIYALRALRRSPGFTAVAILSLAMGIGANAAIFSLWSGVLYSSLPLVRQPEQLVILSDPDSSGGWTGRVDGVRQWLTYEEFEQVRDHVDGLSAVMASQSTINGWRIRLDGGEWEDASGRFVSSEFFEMLGVGAAIGQVFRAVDADAETPHVVISHAYWQRRFGGEADVVGRTLVVGKATLTVIGVTPRGFIGETIGQQPDFWLPLGMQPRVQPARDRLHDTPPHKQMWLHVFGRLKPGVTPAQVEAQANAVFHSGLETFYGAGLTEERRGQVMDQRLEVRSAARGASPSRPALGQSLTALLAGVGVLLLIACANLANLQLARGAARRSEMALRVSLGASRGRLLRQLATESLVLAGSGGVAAIAVAAVLHSALVALMAKSDPDFRMTFAIDPLLAAFVVAATIGAAGLFGVLPAWQATRIDAGESLKEQNLRVAGRSGTFGSGRFLVSVQLALSLPLLVGAGLLARTVYNLQHTDLGYAGERMLLVRVNLTDAGYETARHEDVRRELLAQIQQIPGVSAASFSQLGVFSGGESSATIDVEGYSPRDEADRESTFDVVGPGYFAALGVPIVLGRDILDSDAAGSLGVCVINEAFAKQFFEGRNPIGLRITFDREDGQTAHQVIGVAGNARTQDLRGDIAPRFYVPASQKPGSATSPTFLIGTATETAPGGVASAMPAVRMALQRVRADLPIVMASSIEEEMAPLTAQDQATAQLAAAFGVVALALAVIGLYGVLSYGVARRTGEIAIRIALGARSLGVIALVFRETAWLVAAGLALGVGLAYAASGVIDSRLYGIAPQDPLTLVTATATLLLAAASAVFVPARRASRVDPMTALRQQ